MQSNPPQKRSHRLKISGALSSKLASGGRQSAGLLSGGSQPVCVGPPSIRTVHLRPTSIRHHFRVVKAAPQLHQPPDSVKTSTDHKPSGPCIVPDSGACTAATAPHIYGQGPGPASMLLSLSHASPGPTGPASSMVSPSAVTGPPPPMHQLGGKAQLPSVSTISCQPGLRHPHLPGLARGFAHRGSVGSWRAPQGQGSGRRARPDDDSDDDCADDAVSHPPAKRAAYGLAADATHGGEGQQRKAPATTLSAPAKPSPDLGPTAAIASEAGAASAAVLDDAPESKELSPSTIPVGAEVSPDEHDMEEKSHLLPGYVPWPLPLPAEHEE
jgi:hypothetical protein